MIEILVVIFIVSIVTTVALLTINRNENKQVESFAGQLSEMMTLAVEQAMLQPSVLGLRVNKDSFHFAALKTASSDKQSAWLPLQDKILSNHPIPDNVEVKVVVSGEDSSLGEEKEKTMPQITISTSGDFTPFTIYVGKKGHKPRYLIVGEANGNITNKILS